MLNQCLVACRGRVAYIRPWSRANRAGFEGDFMQGNAAIATRPVNNRSALSNDLRRLRADVDMRSAEGRRFCDIYDALAVEFSGADAGRIRELAFSSSRERAAQPKGCGP